MKYLASVPNLIVETIGGLECNLLLDSIKLADSFNKFWKSDQKLRVFLQINTSDEDAKNGLDPSECILVADHILKNCPNLNLMGLMTIGAIREDYQENPDFVKLMQLSDIVSHQLGIKLEKSFGMSHDFELAIKQGSTNVRVGSSIFGERSAKH